VKARGKVDVRIPPAISVQSASRQALARRSATARWRDQSVPAITSPPIHTRISGVIHQQITNAEAPATIVAPCSIFRAR
jgi:hypothetical protein